MFLARPWTQLLFIKAYNWSSWVLFATGFTIWQTLYSPVKTVSILSQIMWKCQLTKVFRANLRCWVETHVVFFTNHSISYQRENRITDITSDGRKSDRIPLVRAGPLPSPTPNNNPLCRHDHQLRPLLVVKINRGLIFTSDHKFFSSSPIRVAVAWLWFASAPPPFTPPLQ